MVVHRINIFGGRIQLVQDLNMVHFLKGAKRFSAENSGLYKTVTKKKNRREYNKKGKTTNRTTLPETGYTDMIFNMKTRYFLKIYLLKKELVIYYVMRIFLTMGIYSSIKICFQF